MPAKNSGPAFQDVSQTKKRFLAINRERLVRTHNCLTERQRNFLDLLPLLFHVNHPSLPGFVSKNTPSGVAEYAPSRRTLDAARRVAKTFDQKRRALLRYDIAALYLMGSSGTVAYSKKSDFDIWICYQVELTRNQLAELQDKATAIENWAATLDLEVHFFLVDPAAFKQGIHDDVSAESSGSAQHFLLMEEFFRTGLLLAGRYPLWWLVPPDREDQYEECLDMLRQRRFISDSEGIDFGGMPKVPAEEFFGAALWQLYKGIDSPYKSALKLLLMEAYATEYPASDLLCHRFKRAIYAGETNLNELDPYMMLLRKLEEHLVSRGEEERLALVRRCFYFKANEPLSTLENPKYTTWSRELMRELTDVWGWSSDYLSELDARGEWKVDRVIPERQILVKALTHSYQSLSDFARENAQLVSINQRDLNILGRKLYAAFERKAGKIEIVNRGISDDLRESHITVAKVKARDGRETWLLFNSAPNSGEGRRDRPLKRSAGLCELLAWCHFNSLVDTNTVIACNTPDDSVTPRELKEMMACLQRLFPVPDVLRTRMEDFARSDSSTQMAMFINLGVDPLAEHTRNGMHLTSGRTDPLSYGGLYENLALTFDQITLTNWKEVLTARYVGSEGLLECLREYFRWSPPSKGVPPPPVSAHCFSYGRGLAIQQRMEELLQQLIAWFYGKPGQEYGRYVLNIESRYYVLYFEKNEILQYQKFDTYQGLLRYFAEGVMHYSPVQVDRHALTNRVLSTIFEANKKDALQLFYHSQGQHMEVYVLDERGSLYTQRIAFAHKASSLNQFTAFFDSILHRRSIEMVGQECATGVPDLEFYEVVNRLTGGVSLSRREIIRSRRSQRYFSIQVIADIEAGNTAFRIYCDDREFSSIEYDEGLYGAVAKHVLERRRSGERYPIYITDLDLPHALLSDDVASGGDVQTIHYLNFKRRIETQLYEAMQHIADKDGS